MQFVHDISLVSLYVCSVHCYGCSFPIHFASLIMPFILLYRCNVLFVVLVWLQQNAISPLHCWVLISFTGVLYMCLVLCIVGVYFLSFFRFHLCHSVSCICCFCLSSLFIDQINLLSLSFSFVRELFYVFGAVLWLFITYLLPMSTFHCTRAIHLVV